MKVELLDTHDIIKANGYTNLIRKLSPELFDRQGVDLYMSEFKKRFFRTHGIILNFKDPKTFIHAIDKTGKFLKIIN